MQCMLACTLVKLPSADAGPQPVATAKGVLILDGCQIPLGMLCRHTQGGLRDRVWYRSGFAGA